LQRRPQTRSLPDTQANSRPPVPRSKSAAWLPERPIPGKCAGLLVSQMNFEQKTLEKGSVRPASEFHQVIFSDESGFRQAKTGATKQDGDVQEIT